MLPELDGFVGTSSCPVMAGKNSYEMWPHPVEIVSVGEIHVLPSDGPAACE